MVLVSLLSCLAQLCQKQAATLGARGGKRRMMLWIGLSLLLLGVAAWMRYVGGVDEQGAPIEIRDPLKAELAERVAASGEGEARVKALLGMKAVFGEDLAQNAEVVATLTRFWLQLREQGARATVAQAVGSP